MKIIRIFACVAALVFLGLQGCSQGNAGGMSDTSEIKAPAGDTTEDSQNETSEPSQDFSAVCYLDETTVYLRGFYNGENALRESIVARYDTVSGEVKVVQRNSEAMDGMENMTAARAENGEETVFTGGAFLGVKNNEAVRYSKLEQQYLRDAFYNFPSDKLAYVDNRTFDLMLLDCGTEKSTVLYKASEDKNGAVNMTYKPIINAEGSKVLFQRVIGNALMYDSVACCDTAGKILFETGEIERISDVLYTYWCKNGFCTVQTTDVSEKTKSGELTVITLYSDEGKVIKTTELECALAYNLLAAATANPYLPFSVYNDKLNSNGIRCYSLAIVNPETGEAYIVRDTEEIIDGQDISPSGSKIVWIENGGIQELDLQTASKTPIPKATLKEDA